MKFLLVAAQAHPQSVRSGAETCHYLWAAAFPAVQVSRIETKEVQVLRATVEQTVELSVFLSRLFEHNYMTQRVDAT